MGWLMSPMHTTSPLESMTTLEQSWRSLMLVEYADLISAARIFVGG